MIPLHSVPANVRPTETQNVSVYQERGREYGVINHSMGRELLNGTRTLPVETKYSMSLKHVRQLTLGNELNTALKR